MRRQSLVLGVILALVAAAVLTYWMGIDGIGRGGFSAGAADAEPAPGLSTAAPSTGGELTADPAPARMDLFSGEGTQRHSGDPNTSQSPTVPEPRSTPKDELRWLTEPGPDGVGHLVGARRNGKKHGLWRQYGDDGVLLFESTYVDGKPEGPWKSYERSGIVHEINEYRQGKLHGISRGYFSDGSRWTVTKFDSGSRTDCWIEYNRDGTVKAQGNAWEPALESDRER